MKEIGCRSGGKSLNWKTQASAKTVPIKLVFCQDCQLFAGLEHDRLAFAAEAVDATLGKHR